MGESVDLSLDSLSQDSLDHQDEPYTKGGKFYLPLPLGLGHKEVSEEVYAEEVRKNKLYEAKQQEEHKQNKQYRENLDEAGFVAVRENDRFFTDKEYQDRLIELLKQNDLKNIDEIPLKRGLIENSSSETTALTTKVKGALFDLIVTDLTKAADSYEHRIIELLDEYEKQVTYKTISKKQYVQIVTLFKMGCVHDLTLYYRFEKLKKQDNSNYHQRVYMYGAEFGHEINLEKLPPESALFDDSLAYSLIVLHILQGIVEAKDIDPDTERFHQKFKALYKHILKCKMGGLYKYQHISSLLPTEEDVYDNATDEEKAYISSKFKDIPYLQSKGHREGMLTYERNRIARELLAQREVTPEFAQEVKRQEKNESYNILRSGYMQRVLGFSREELNKSVDEAKKEFVVEFAHYFERLSVDTLAIDLSDTKKESINLQYLHYIRASVKEAASYYGLDADAIGDAMKQGLQRAMQEGITKLKNKELLTNETKVTYKGPHRSTSYKGQLRTIMNRINFFEQTILHMGYDNLPIVQERQENKALYRKEYKDYHTTLFKQKRADIVKKRYGLDATTSKELLGQVSNAVEQKFREATYTHLKREQERYRGIPYRGLLDDRLSKILNSEVLFKRGFYAFMQSAIPEDTPRKRFLNQVRKNVTQGYLTKVISRLSNLDTADHYSYIALEPLVKLFEHYRKHKKVDADFDLLKQNYFTYVQRHAEDRLQKEYKRIDAFLAGESQLTSRDIFIDFYEIFSYFTGFLNDYLPKKTSTEEIKDYSVYNYEGFLGQYPSDYLNALSLLHYSPDEVEKIVPQQLVQAVITACHNVEQRRVKFREKLVKEWVKINAIPGGKLQRIVEEHMKNKSLSDTDAIQGAIHYILENMESIVLADIKMTVIDLDDLGGIGPYARHTIKELVREILNEWKAKFRQNLLGSNENIRKIEG